MRRTRMPRARVAPGRGVETAKGAVETFIVRIYRRDLDSADGPAGIVECVDSGERQPFVGRDELWNRLFVAGTRNDDHEPNDDVA